MWGEKMFVYPRVRDLREYHDKTQKQIVGLLNMQLTVYQRYERGERELPLWAAIKLADYYNITLDYSLRDDMVKVDCRICKSRIFITQIAY